MYVLGSSRLKVARLTHYCFREYPHEKANDRRVFFVFSRGGIFGTRVSLGNNANRSVSLIVRARETIASARYDDWKLAIDSEYQ